MVTVVSMKTAEEKKLQTQRHCLDLISTNICTDTRLMTRLCLSAGSH